MIHLAYATTPNPCFENPLGDLLQKLPATVQLFSEVAARDGRLILASSGAMRTVSDNAPTRARASHPPPLPWYCAVSRQRCLANSALCATSSMSAIWPQES